MAGENDKWDFTKMLVMNGVGEELHQMEEL